MAILILIFFAYLVHTHSHPFDKSADKTDEEIKNAVVEVASDKSLRILNDFVFDERTSHLSDPCVELLRQLLHPDPQKRLSSDSFLRHPWTQGLAASGKTMENTQE